MSSIHTTDFETTFSTTNSLLVAEGYRLGIEEYFKRIFNKSIYDEFMIYFLELVKNPDEFCVSHVDLLKYGVLTSKQKSSHAKNLLEITHGFKEGVDFIVNEEPGDRGQTKKTYMMKPRVFKKCLMRSRNTSVYSDYYLDLEEVYVHYQDYERAYLNFLCSGKDDKIDKLVQKVDEQTMEMKEQSRKINELLGFATDAKEDAKVAKADAEIIKEKLDDAHDRLDVQDAKIDTIKDLLLETSDNSIVPFEKETKRAEFVLLRSKDDQTKFKFIRGKKAYNDTKLRKEYGDKYDIIRREYDANPGHLFCLFRETVRTEMIQTKKEIRESKTMTKSDKDTVLSTLEKIRFNNTCITLLNDYTADELYAKIDSVFQKKYMNYHSSCEDDSSE
jgi:hypothetical protein